MEKSKERDSDQELMRSMKVSKAVAAMAIPSVISSPVSYTHLIVLFSGKIQRAPTL